MKKKQIVLIDDDQTTNILNKLTIERARLVDEVIIFNSPLLALDYFSNREENDNSVLILLDINMPKMNGWELLKQYAAIAKKKDGIEKIVMLTSSIDPRDQVQADENEFVSDLKYKPLSLKATNELIKTHLK